MSVPLLLWNPLLAQAPPAVDWPRQPPFEVPRFQHNLPRPAVWEQPLWAPPYLKFFRMPSAFDEDPEAYKTYPKKTPHVNDLRNGVHPHINNVSHLQFGKFQALHDPRRINA